MTFRKTFGTAAVGAAALATAFAAMVPGVASAQTYRGQPSYQGGAYQGGAYDTQGGYYYDGCRRAENSRSVGGGLAGAVAGAVIGGNVASRNARDEGAILGGLLGAVVGSQVGKSTAACSSNTNGYDNNAYNSGYGYDTRSYPGAYDQRSYAPAYDQRSYAPAYDDRYYGSDYGYAQEPYYDNRTARRGGGVYDYPVAQGSSYDNDCAMAESPIYLPDGRVQKRLVRVCRDSRGQYQIVE